MNPFVESGLAVLLAWLTVYVLFKLLPGEKIGYSKVIVWSARVLSLAFLAVILIFSNKVLKSYPPLDLIVFLPIFAAAGYLWGTFVTRWIADAIAKILEKRRLKKDPL
jgi:hypothetical protein